MALDPMVAAATGAPNIDTDQVTDITPDEVDPSWSKVTFVDGRTETMPTTEAQALPQAAPMGPPAPPAPVGPGVPSAQSPEAAPGGFSAGPGLGSELPGAELPQAPPTVELGPDGLPVRIGEAPGELQPAATGEVPAPKFDPNAQIVAPGTAGGVMRPAGESQSSAVQEVSYVQDPTKTAQQVGAGFEELAQAADQEAINQFEAQRVQAEADAANAKAAYIQRQKDLHLAQMMQEETERTIKVIEDTPIDDDWTQGSWGRQVSAWFALALSGFLQGATKGANPALNQMMAHLNQAQERFIAQQRADKNSKLNRRIQQLGDERAAVASIRMQLPQLLQKQMDTQARAAGMSELVPALTTAGAKFRADGLKAQQEVYGRVKSNAEIRHTREFKATDPTGPVYQGDLVFRQLGMDQKAINAAFDPKDGNIGNLVSGAQDLELAAAVLEEIARKGGGQLPQQEVLTVDGTWLGKKLAQMGNEESMDAQKAQQMLERAMLAAKQTMNIKSIDSENEGQSFRLTVDPGTSPETVAAVRHLADNARKSALSSAERFTRNPQGLIDYAIQTHNNNVGPRGDAPRPLRGPVKGFPTEEQTIKAATAPAATAPTGEAPAPGPKAPTSSRRGSYRRLRESKPEEPR